MYTAKQRQQEAQKVTLVGSLLDAVLGIAKILVGLFFHSHALIADGIHSLSDLATDFMVVLVLHLSHQEPDEDHPWGHARFETAATVMLGGLLIAVAGAMAYNSVGLMFSGAELLVPEWPTLVVAGLSVVSKEWIYRYTLAAGKRLKSDLIIANAWHSRSDAFSSIVVLIGIGGAMLGWAWLDALTAVLVALLIAKIGWDLTWKSIKELVDTALPEDQVRELEQSVQDVDGVISVHSLKTRLMGGQSLLEMHIQVESHLSASEGHYIGDTAVRILKTRFDDIGDVIFHIDTYNDDQRLYCDTLPLRAEVEQALRAAMSELHPDLRWEKLALYYISARIELELNVDGALLARCGLTGQALQQALRDNLQQHYWYASLSLWLAATDA
ncbi:cation diffusion facilitator family transporter [Marinobacterium rhizophilum]|uniref:Cation transporter n=1 Tax=Marinobacterium rhizophilum TaxID=420402 RepID=A0ABY5HR12_9GAMM|nr:cation diffusion facilitator family transporter [Marinobacterium rhizophilum]UTW13326.1 cation transporter [Marinobacterium rhizophilum]